MARGAAGCGQHHRTGAARWWREDSILCNQSHASHVSAANIRAGFEAARALSGGRPMPLVAEAGPLSGTTREARDLLGSPEARDVYSAMAVIVRSPVARMVMNVFVHVIQPHVSVRLFTDVDEARAWARQQVVDG